MLKIKHFISVMLLMSLTTAGWCDSGYELWLNYKPAGNAALRAQYASYLSRVSLCPNRFYKEIREELDRAAGKITSSKVVFAEPFSTGEGIVYVIDKTLSSLGKEGYKIDFSSKNGKQILYIRSFSDQGLLYGTFELIRKMQCGLPLDKVNLTEKPKHALRLLNHWDDLSGSIERGYGGNSLWNWDTLPKVEQRYIDYARANASIGINGIVLNNVNTDPRILRKDYLHKIAALADILRKYNIKIYLSVNFGSSLKPSNTPDQWKKWGGIGDLNTADPADEKVVQWWKDKTAEVYALIPDLGGYLVKANSEGMPGPQDYGRSHSDGANMLARALKPFHGIVMWRTFVYNPQVDQDRAKRPYKEFIGLDGKFDENVILQAKNGPLDFQPIEAVQPLFGAVRKTNMMAELQITQEYIGQSSYLVYLLPMWRSFFDFDTYSQGKGSTVSKLSSAESYPGRISAIAGVANTGNDENWCGNQFAQANWFAYGRLAWNPDYSDSSITEQWIQMTWNCDAPTLATIKEIMMPTWLSFVKSQTPYGLGMTVAAKDHFSPDFAARATKSWDISSKGIGNNRSSSGSDYVSQYFKPNRDQFNNLATCPENLLLFFHFVSWEHQMKSGKTLREELFKGLRSNIELTRRNIKLWQGLQGKVDDRRHNEVTRKLEEQLKASQDYYDNGYLFFSKSN